MEKRDGKPIFNLKPEMLESYDYIFFEYKALVIMIQMVDIANFMQNLIASISSIRDSNLINRYVKRVLAVPLKTTAIRFGIQMNGNSTSYMWVSKVLARKGR